MLHVFRLALIAATGTGLLPSLARDCASEPNSHNRFLGTDSATSVLLRQWSVHVLRTVFMVAERYDMYATLLVTMLVGCPAWYTVYVSAGKPDALSMVFWYAVGSVLPRVVLEYYRPIAAAAAVADGVGDGVEQADVKGQTKAASLLGACGSDGKAKCE